MAAVSGAIRFFWSVLVPLAVFINRMRVFLSYSHSSQLATARFAQAHETARLAAADLANLETSLLLGRSHFNRLAAVPPTKKRRELGNVLYVAPPRMGKSKAAIAQLLNFKHSVVVLDVKGELYHATAGFRSTLGPLFVFDHQGYGNAYDPKPGQHVVYTSSDLSRLDILPLL
jgi:type IV secretory pathway TraG/TraD family ATPase VirD4